MHSFSYCGTSNPGLIFVGDFSVNVGIVSNQKMEMGMYMKQMTVIGLD
jgi:hypothetical protein